MVLTTAHVAVTSYRMVQPLLQEHMTYSWESRRPTTLSLHHHLPCWRYLIFCFLVISKGIRSAYPASGWILNLMWCGGSMGALKSCMLGDLDHLGHFCHLWFPLMCDVPVFGPSMVSKSQFAHHLLQAGNASPWFLVSHIIPLVTGAVTEEIHPQSSVSKLRNRGLWPRVEMKDNSPLS